MLRREAIKKAAILLGGTITLPNILKAWENPTILNPNFYISPAQEAMLAEVVETIIPTTDTPGAKAAGVAPCLLKLLYDFNTKTHWDYILQTLMQLDADTKTQFGMGFAETTPQNRIAMLKIYEQKAKNENDAFQTLVKSWNLPKGIWVSPFFPAIKSMTITGYFTSEIGCTQALRYSQIPGTYESVDYKKGDKLWVG
ncbi:MAG: gluconate 2-dehydrogenase subunit 3 family protein [Saprospiraceae bacterium]